MTPSGWHNDTMSRDAGHDEMQFQFWRRLSATTELNERTIKGRVFNRTAVVFEHIFEAEGSVLGFGDVVEWWSYRGTYGNGGSEASDAIRVWEIKPKIHSVGGIVRQLRSIRLMVEKWGKLRSGRITWNRYEISEISVIAVVPADDGKIEMLKGVLPYQVHAWKAAP